MKLKHVFIKHVLEQLVRYKVLHKEGKLLSYLQWLNDEDTLKKGDNHGYQPAHGAVLPKFQPIKHREISRYNTGCDHKQPPEKNEPPG